MDMEKINLFANNEKELGTLIQEIRIYIQDIGMEFVIKQLCHDYNEINVNQNKGRNRTAKSRKNQNA